MSVDRPWWYRERNRRIYDAYFCGATIPDLAYRFLLTEETIKNIIREERLSMANSVGSRWIQSPVKVVGKIKSPEIPQEDYDDYHLGQLFSMDEVKRMVRLGSFTPGIILQREGTPKVIVVGEDSKQELRVM